MKHPGFHFEFGGDGDGFTVTLRVRWETIIAFTKALIATVLTIIGLLAAFSAAPELVQFIELLP